MYGINFRYQVRARKLRRILRFLQKRYIPIRIKYQWNTSIGYSNTRTYQGVIKEYSIVSREFMDDIIFFDVQIEFMNGDRMEEELSTMWEFDWSGTHNRMKKVRLCEANGGPYNYFTIERLDI